MEAAALETMSDIESGDQDGGEGTGPQARDVTQLLRAWSEGDHQALERLTPLVYKELHRRAHRQMAQERSGQTLQTTALVNEIYVQLIDLRGVSWRDRAHFFALSSRLIRRVLIDAARSRASQKRGAGSPHVEFDENLLVSTEPRADVMALDDALTALAAIDQRKSQVVELRFFGGLSIEETAEVLKVSPETVKRDWKLAKAWLRRELRQQVSASATREPPPTG
jgi:RNA polymerase sigma factor (TIGR02999 family)